LSAHNDFFEEIAKYRAMRRIWSRLCREQLGATQERSMWMRFHTQTAGSTLTQQQPLNNVVRTSVQALAAVLGGTQSLHTNSYDEAIALPTEEAVTLAIRTQQIIAHESRAPAVVDPLGGSYFVESLTSDLEERIEATMAEIEAAGGIVSAAQSGYIQRMKYAEADRHYSEVESGERVVVGVNRYATEEQGPVPVFKIDAEFETRQIERLEQWRGQRDQTAVAEALARLREVSAAGDNVMEPAITAVLAGATIGEIGGTFKSVHGEQREPDQRALLS
jgi:methylmalonyl-CoA mutase N-terminal domain/subunit